MELTHPYQQNQGNIQHQDANSQFLVVKSDDVQRIEALSLLFPRLSSMIRNNKGKNLVLNFRDEQQRSLIVMIVSETENEAALIQMAS
ncbi:hypothetical protein [Pedobacter ginsengisoli]|jgi:hypothetical protein|uniref:hypothetical protein n=1 Tax=Pedobacter ginsengisoli TaxID=363852 RepID=UPI00254C6C05|nr:hypothetical protein [Pedobacter ginsengisoli]